MSALIYEKISLVIADMEHVSKKGKNTQQNWNYRSIDQIKNAVNITFKKHKVFYSPEILEHIKEEQVTTKGTKMSHYTVKVKFKIFTTDGSFIEAITCGEAADSGDKGLGKAQTYAEKTMLLQVFNIPTEEQEDPDKDAHEFIECISKEDALYLKELAKELGWTQAEKDALALEFGIENITDLPKSEFPRFEARLKGATN